MRIKGKWSLAFRLISIVLSVVITLLAVTEQCPVKAEEVNVNQVTGESAVWDGTADISWYTGNKDRYEISTAEQLAGMVELTKSTTDFSGVTIVLTKDIVLNDTSKFDKWNKKKKAPKNKWTPIGEKGHPFCGVFNGDGHTIKGLYIKDTKTYSNWYNKWYADGGLFGYVSEATIVNLKMEKSYINVLGNIGTVAVNAQNSFFLGIELTDTVLSNGTAGGIVGASTYDYSSWLLNVLTYISFAALGAWFNPLIFGDSLFLPNDYTGVVLYACKVNNLTCKNTNETGGMVCKGGDKDSGIGIANCLINGFKVTSNGKRGAFTPMKSNDKTVLIKNCYAYNVKSKGTQTKLIDKKFFEKIDKTRLYSNELANQLGKAFEWKKDSAPVLKRFVTTNPNPANYQLIADGEYSVGHGKGYLNVDLADSEGKLTKNSDIQYFTFTYRAGGYYTITAPNGKVVEYSGDSVFAKNVYDPDVFTQKWVLIKNGDNYYLKAKAEGRCLGYSEGFLFIAGRGVVMEDYSNMTVDNTSWFLVLKGTEETMTGDIVEEQEGNTVSGNSTITFVSQEFDTLSGNELPE